MDNYAYFFLAVSAVLTILLQISGNQRKELLEERAQNMEEHFQERRKLFIQANPGKFKIKIYLIDGTVYESKMTFEAGPDRWGYNCVAVELAKYYMLTNEHLETSTGSYIPVNQIVKFEVVPESI